MNTSPLEKITINANTADLGKIDLLVSEGFFATRTEFIKLAIKALLEQHEQDTRDILKIKVKNDWFIGVSAIAKSELEVLKAKGQKKTIVGMGLLVIDQDIPLQLLQDVITAIKVYGVCRCAPDIKTHYAL